MIELVLTVCTIASAPTQCREVQLTYDGISERQCLMFAQFEIAKWVGDHPNYRFTRYTCRPAGMFAKL